MNIVLTRIDNRLIHGQVLEAWIPYTHADCIVVANDEVARTALKRLMMEASVPRGIRVIIGTVTEVAELLRSRALDSCRILLLFASSQDALLGHRAGIPFASLNLGNMHAGKGKMKLSCTISLNAEDVENLQTLESDGVRIVSRCVPHDTERSWRKLIRQWEGEDAP